MLADGRCVCYVGARSFVLFGCSVAFGSRLFHHLRVFIVEWRLHNRTAFGSLFIFFSLMILSQSRARGSKEQGRRVGGRNQTRFCFVLFCLVWFCFVLFGFVLCRNNKLEWAGGEGL